MNSIEPLLLALWKDLQDVRVLSQIGVIAASLPWWQQFKAHGVEIPYPQREVRMLQERDVPPRQA